MKRTLNLLLLFYLFCGIAKISAEGEGEPEIENDLMQTAPFSTDDPSYLAKHDLGEKPSTSIFWPEISFLKRMLSAIFPSHKLDHQATTHNPRIIWKFQFFRDRNTSDELLEATTEGATDVGDQDLLRKTGTTSSPPVPTKKNSRRSSRERNQKAKDSQLAKQFPSNMLSLENFEKRNGEKNVHEKVKNDEKSRNKSDINSSFDKSSNGTRLDIYISYVWTINWRSFFVHSPFFVAGILIVVLLHKYKAGCCTCECVITAPEQDEMKRVKVNPTKYKRSKDLEV